MGAVWRAEDVEAGSWRAVKVLRPEYARDPAAVARFVRERNALLALQHPNVVTLHDMIVEGERLALVMDLLTEGDLDKFRRDHGGTLPPGLAAELVAQACDGLAAAHATDIVHRDLKPGNVLMDQGRARLTDFGIARIGGESPVTVAGTVMGTISYMAPEALAGAEPAPACDVYAAGVTLYELLAGRPPFTGQAAMVIHDHLHAAPARPDGLPDPLWQLITACLAKDPAARPTAAQLAAALRAPQLLGGETLAHPAGPWQPETTEADASLSAGPHTITGIGWLSPAGPMPRGPVPGGPVPPGPVPGGPVPPRAAGEPANRNASGKRRRTWGIAAAALVVVAAGLGAFVAFGRGSAAAPAASTVAVPSVTGHASPAATDRSLSPTPSASKAASRSGAHPAAPASSPSAALPSADARSGPPPAGAASPPATSAATASAPSAPATSAAAATPPPSATTLAGQTVTGLHVDEVFPATNGDNGAVQVSWDQVPGATSYTVYMLVKGSFSTDRTLANEGDLSPGSHEVMVTPEPGGKGSSVSFTVTKK